MTDRNKNALPADLVLGFYGDETPCTFELTDVGCTAKAKFLMRMTHQDDGSRMCGPEGLEWAPFCPEHKSLIEKTLKGFWAALTGAPPCSGCGRAVEVGGVKPL